ncbi:MAG: response regulator [Desulfotignum sp.]|nr:response regulator [Desulfotignum sp.]MCF8112746.1 response regulator [Desulfotignum sp.]
MSDSCNVPADAGSAACVRPDNAGEAWKILVIDDEPDVREIMAISLEDAGYQTISAPDGETGLRELAAHSPQILITDIKMPGMSGLEVLEKARQIRPDTQVIITTGFADIKKAITALQNDASDFITKPVDDTTLHLALKRAMQRYRDRKELADYTRLLEQTVLNQEKILHQEKMMSLGRLAASMVHEINNPLSGILNYIRLMIRLTEKPGWDDAARDRFKNYLAVINQETQRCADLVSGLLAFSRKSGPGSCLVDICELLDYSLKLCNHKLELSDIILERSCQPDIPRVSGDFNQLQQCLINLIFNSIDAIGAGDGTADMPGPDSGGTCAGVSGRPGPEPRGRIWVNGYKDENQVCIQVKDNGRGISPDHLPCIFEPFFTTKDHGHGVGLGLSTVYGIIEHHSGTIAVKSTPGRGTCFTIRLPAADRAAPAEETSNV